MNTTTSTAITGLSPFATEVIDIALDGGTFTSWTKVTPNRWGGFDITGRSQVIRVTADDETWTVRVMSLNMVEQGSQTFTGCFAAPIFVGMAVQGLL